MIFLKIIPHGKIKGHTNDIRNDAIFLCFQKNRINKIQGTKQKHTYHRNKSVGYNNQQQIECFIPRIDTGKLVRMYLDNKIGKINGNK